MFEESMEDEKVLYSIVDNTCVVKMIGAIIYKTCQNFDKFLNKIKKDPKINKFVIDLTETTYINSTNLGLITKIYDISIKNSYVRPVIISTHDNINEILQTVGFGRIFDLIHDPENLDTSFQEIPDTKASENNLGKLMLDSHRALSKLNLKNREQFKDVIKLFEKDFKKKSQLDKKY